jgi:xanthine dehydrogenase accessory factor
MTGPTGIDLLARADGLRSQRTPFVLATVVRAERPTSVRPGDRAIVLGDGTVEGFAGGACALSTLRAQSSVLLGRGVTGSTLLRITPEPESGTPAPGTVVADNPCLSGGSLEILLEAVVPPLLVQVFGASPIAQALVAVATAAGYQPQSLTDPAAVAADAAAVVVASHGHDELPVLRAALHAGTPYVALVASPKRGTAVLAELELTAEQAQRVKTPAGLDIGARGPGEVAVSILAELVARRPGAPAAVTTPQLAVDPVCGMSVAVAPQTLRYEHAGQTWYFCAPGCRSAFVADPGRYAAAGPAQDRGGR